MKSFLSTRSPITRPLIAPCGMNCGVCIAHLRSTNQCSGCIVVSANKVLHCEQCSIKNCKELKASGGTYCFSCKKFPCKRLRQLDKRYRTKYGMSMIDNLRSIEQYGIRKFLSNENDRWKCGHCGNIVSVHRPDCLTCGARKSETQIRGLNETMV